MKQVEMQQLTLKDNSDHQSEKDNGNHQSERNKVEATWIIVFGGLSDVTKNELQRNQAGFFLNHSMTQCLAFKDDNFKKGFINTNSSYIRYFSSDKCTKPDFSNQLNNKSPFNNKILLHFDSVSTSFLPDEKHLHALEDLILKKRISLLSVNTAIDNIINNKEILERFGKNAEKQLMNFKNNINADVNSILDIQLTLEKLNQEMSEAYSLIRKYRINRKIEYVNKVRDLDVDYDEKIFKEIKNHTPNGLECCACTYVAPWEVK